VGEAWGSAMNNESSGSTTNRESWSSTGLRCQTWAMEIMSDNSVGQLTHLMLFAWIVGGQTTILRRR
jgi:hypothetical protein